MTEEHALAALSRLARRTNGVFRGTVATDEGITRKQLARFRARGIVARVLPDTYALVAFAPSDLQRLRAALVWAGDGAVAGGRSAGVLYALEGVVSVATEIVLPASRRMPSNGDLVIHVAPRHVVRPRVVAGFPCSGIEFTLLRLAATLDAEAFEVAFEDARRRRLTSIPAMGAYLDRVSGPGRPGVNALRAALRAVDPVHAARSTLEVKTRRLLDAHGIRGYVREHPLTWNGRTYRYDFAFPANRLIIETNGRRWHDDATDYEHDNEKWSVPGRLGWRIVFATWEKVTRRPDAFVADVRTALARRSA